MDRVLFAIADYPVTLETAAFAAAGLFGALLIAVLVVLVAAVAPACRGSGAGAAPDC